MVSTADGMSRVAPAATVRLRTAALAVIWGAAAVPEGISTSVVPVGTTAGFQLLATFQAAVVPTQLLVGAAPQLTTAPLRRLM